jgi:serine/threonine protein kinase
MGRLGEVLVETYRVDRLIAEGGMAAVYEATHLRVPKKFAVKFMKVQLVHNAEALQRFRREAEIIATIDHPNVVQLIDYNLTADGTPYIVLEFLDGEHLGACIERGRLALPDAVRIGVDVASALTAAHARDITHRDLKPENIILSKGGTVKVVDFGVAKLRNAPELTAMNVVVGTVGYMAPEQITGGRVDPRTDQFALASIVYYMLSGTPAFEIEGSVAAHAMRILHHTPPALPEVSEQVNRVLQRGMAKDPSHRYPTVGEFQQALAQAASVTGEQEIIPLHDEGLPPLAAESTTIAPPPVSNDRTDRVQSPMLSSQKTQQLESVFLLDPPGASRPTLPPNGQRMSPVVTSRVPLPVAERVTLQPSADRVATPIIAPHPTLVGMKTVEPQHEYTGVRPRDPKPPPRWLWIAVGAAAGGSVALIWLLIAG